MMWLSRNTKVLDISPFKNGKLMPVLCDQITQCSGSLTFSPVSATSTNDVPTIRGKRIMDRTRLHAPIT